MPDEKIAFIAWPKFSDFIDLELHWVSVVCAFRRCRCGRQNMLRPYIKNWEWEWIFGRAVKTISSPGEHSLCLKGYLWNILSNVQDILSPTAIHYIRDQLLKLTLEWLQRGPIFKWFIKIITEVWKSFENLNEPGNNFSM